MIFRELKGLQDIISVSIGGSSYKDEGWTFNDELGAIPDTVNNIYHLHELYTKADPVYTGRITVPTLWDIKKQTIVNNESSEIVLLTISIIPAGALVPIPILPVGLTLNFSDPLIKTLKLPPVSAAFGSNFI